MNLYKHPKTQNLFDGHFLFLFVFVEFKYAPIQYVIFIYPHFTMFSKKSDITRFQAISTKKWRTKEVVRVFGWLRNAFDFGFDTPLKHNGFIGL